jgi:hypothetical protein
MTVRVRAVSDEEREALGRIARSRTLGAGLVRRAQIVLHALEGLKAPEIGARMDLALQLRTFRIRILPETIRRCVRSSSRRRSSWLPARARTGSR